jgi:pyruvate, orthophosphate dikinase
MTQAAGLGSDRKRAVPASWSGVPLAPGVACGALTTWPAEPSRGSPRLLVARAPIALDILEILRPGDGLVCNEAIFGSHVAILARELGIPALALPGAKLLPDGLGFEGRVLRWNEVCELDGCAGVLRRGTSGKLPGDDRTEPNESLLAERRRWIARGRVPVQCFISGSVPRTIEAGFRLGAEGVGGCRMEHVLLECVGVNRTRSLLSSGGEADLDKPVAEALAEALGRMLTAARGRPFFVRLADINIDEWAPMAEVEARDRRRGAIECERGFRSMSDHPALFQSQLKGISDARRAAHARGMPVDLTIVVPFIEGPFQLEESRCAIHAVARRHDLDLPVGAEIGLAPMVEIPSAALSAGELALASQALVIGTNDLTQLTHARPRSASVSGASDEIFRSLSANAAARLLEMAILDARRSNPKIRIGCCGEHVRDNFSLRLIESLGVDFVSCAVDRLPQMLELTTPGDQGQ